MMIGEELDGFVTAMQEMEQIEQLKELKLS
jgi:hypothetical protein